MKIIIELDHFSGRVLTDEELIHAVTRAIHDETVFGDLFGYGFTVRRGPVVIHTDEQHEEEGKS